MVAYLTKSNASEGFNQIIDFLNGSAIKYALTVNPNIYVSCIKQFWTTVAVKKVNDVIRVGKGFSEVETPLFERHVSAADGEVTTVDEEPSIPSPTPPTLPPQPSQDILSTSQRVKKLERRHMVRVLKLRRLQKVGTTQRVETSDETVMDDVTNQGRMIAEIDQDVDVVLEDDKEEDETEPAEVQEVVDVVTTIKIITKVVTAASETITAASTNIIAAEAQVPAATLTDAPARVTAIPSRRRKEVVIRDLQEELTTSTIIHAKPNPRIRAKEDPAVKRYQVLKRKPQTEAQARKNMMTKEQIEEDENRALKRLNETLAERAAKRQKLDDEVEELKRHLQIVPNEDDDVYTKATPLARKVPVVDYQIIKLNNKPYYKIIRADDTYQLEMFENPDIHAQIWKNQRSVHGPAKVKGWKLLESCGHYAWNCTNKTRVRDSTYYTERLMLVQQEEAGIPLIAEQHDFLAVASNEGE
nr:hypothetical protein [Tanacetum cinerariifolium]